MMKKILILGLMVGAITISNAQVKINSRAVDAAGQGVKAAAFSDADAARMAKEAVEWMDKHNPVAGPKDPYTIRLNKLISKLPAIPGVKMNYKVYKVIDINAFACADGSVRVFSSLMDIMTDDELIGILSHEIGHVVNHDSRDAIKAAYTRLAAINAAASQSGSVAALTDSELGEFANAIIGSKHSRKQESAADDFAYDFLKTNKFNVMGLYTAFQKFVKMEEEAAVQASSTDKMLSSHPDSKKRAEKSAETRKKRRAIPRTCY